MKKVLVAGGAGYIGSACTEYLLDHGYDVTVFDGLITGHREAVDPRARFVLGNLAYDLALDTEQLIVIHVILCSPEILRAEKRIEGEQAAFFIRLPEQIPAESACLCGF